MFGIHDFSLFLAAGILLNLTPGPDTVYILGRSVAQGRGAGVASALGICVGSIFHTCAAALGLSAILATSALAFSAIKLLGGAYLVFLGVKMLLDRGKRLSLPSHFRWSTTGAAFRQGVFDQYSESESGTVFSRVPSPVHRPDVKQQNRSISRVGSYIRHNRNNLVPYLSVVRLVPERALAHERNDRAMAQSNCRRALCFSRSPSRHGEVTI